MKATAKEQARALHDTVEFWFRRKYNLTPHDPRFLEATAEEMLTDYWAHRFADDPKELDEFEDYDFDEESVAEQIGYKPPPVDDWEELK